MWTESVLAVTQQTFIFEGRTQLVGDNVFKIFRGHRNENGELIVIGVRRVSIFEMGNVIAFFHGEDKVVGENKRKDYVIWGWLRSAQFRTMGRLLSEPGGWETLGRTWWIFLIVTSGRKIWLETWKEDKANGVWDKSGNKNFGFIKQITDRSNWKWEENWGSKKYGISPLWETKMNCYR